MWWFMIIFQTKKLYDYKINFGIFAGLGKQFIIMKPQLTIINLCDDAVLCSRNVAVAWIYHCL